MQEFTTVSASSYDPAALATKLTEKSSDGWSVVSIVSTGGDVTAFLSRASTGAANGSGASSLGAMLSGSTSSSTDEPLATGTTASTIDTPDPEPTSSAVSEPAGWAVAPDPSPAASSATTTYAATASPAPAPAMTPAPAAVTPSVPAGWYADPAGRFELRYWDGTTWTEHVSRAGQQYTDPPVA